MKQFLLTCTLTVALLGWSGRAAQAQSTPPTTGPTPSPAPTAVPLDGGASLLLAAGVATGLRKLRQRRPR